jgi:hypothetical protein
MASYPVTLRMVGAVVSVEIPDGHGTWSLGKRTLFSQEITTPITTLSVTIDEKTEQSGPLSEMLKRPPSRSQAPNDEPASTSKI